MANGGPGDQIETFVFNPSVNELSSKICNKLEDNNAELNLKALAQEHQQCPLKTPNDMKVFCSSFLLRMISAEDIHRGKYARLACELMIVWTTPPSPPSTVKTTLLSDACMR
jgi:hypothetical protein